LQLYGGAAKNYGGARKSRQIWIITLHHHNPIQVNL